jgi:hypothetical protein
MVFHVQNYMRETNVWMIRKMRWIFWSIALSIPIYRNTYWDYLGRRVAWRDSLFGGTEAEKQQFAESKRADWGFHPRYEPKLDFSIKTQKHALQSREESMQDMPRLRTRSTIEGKESKMEPVDVRTLVSIVSEHNRQPGAFNYNYPQYFYSTFPEIEQETYVTLGNDQAKRRVHKD